MSGVIRESIFILCCAWSLVDVSALMTDREALNTFLQNHSKEAEKVFNEYYEANWNYVTNMTTYNREIMLNKKSKLDKFKVEEAQKAQQYDFPDRALTKIKNPEAPISENEKKIARYNKLITDMSDIYSKAKVCFNSTQCVPLDPNVSEILAKSRDYDLLVKAWNGWRDATGKKMKSLYSMFVKVSNELFQAQGYTDTGARWRDVYETPTFEDDVRALFQQLLSLYEQLHAYTRRKLKAIYGNEKFPSSGHIPAHLLGDMWAQDWRALTKELSPFPNKPIFDVTDEMVRQNYTAKRIFEMADDFFQSLGMSPMPPEFWNNSMFEKPTDGRDVECHASAFDFYNTKDFRIKMCTLINKQNIEIVHHEMGHIQYYMHYKTQPIQFRSGANPGFQEAVGETVSLSVMTPEHMYKIGLLKTISNDTEMDINYLMEMALLRIAFLPFGYLIDQWRWNVFRGNTTRDKYNEEWWNLRCRYQGVSPPVERTSDDFDPGAKFHIARNVPYIRYFVSFVLQFQFHKALCDKSGYKGPLHRCDIYNSKTAGALFSEMLKLGSSEPPTIALLKFTGQDKIDPKPLLEYFKPLMDYLKRENGDDYGWQPQCLPFCQDSFSEASFNFL